jgi:hypothetical protein
MFLIQLTITSFIIFFVQSVHNGDMSRAHIKRNTGHASIARTFYEELAQSENDHGGVSVSCRSSFNFGNIKPIFGNLPLCCASSYFCD